MGIGAHLSVTLAILRLALPLERFQRSGTSPFLAITAESRFISRKLCVWKGEDVLVGGFFFFLTWKPFLLSPHVGSRFHRACVPVTLHPTSGWRLPTPPSHSPPLTTTLFSLSLSPQGCKVCQGIMCLGVVQWV